MPGNLPIGLMTRPNVEITLEAPGQSFRRIQDISQTIAYLSAHAIDRAQTGQAYLPPLQSLLPILQPLAAPSFLRMTINLNHTMKEHVQAIVTFLGNEIYCTRSHYFGQRVDVIKFRPDHCGRA